MWSDGLCELCKQFVLDPNKWHASSLIKKKYNQCWCECEFRALLSFTLFNSWFTLCWQSLPPRPKEAAIKSLWNNWWSAQSVLTVMWPDEGDPSLALYVWGTGSQYIAKCIFWHESLLAFITVSSSANKTWKLGNEDFWAISCIIWSR